MHGGLYLNAMRVLPAATAVTAATGGTLAPQTGAGLQPVFSRTGTIHSWNYGPNGDINGFFSIATFWLCFLRTLLRRSPVWPDCVLELEFPGTAIVG